MKRFIIISLVVFFTNSVYALSGSGTEQYPYLIQSLADFDEFAGDANYWNDYIRLETDINLAGRTYTTAVIAPDTNESSSGFQGTSFTGSFDGNSKKIINLGINTAGAGNDYLGLFGRLSGSMAYVKNLGIDNAVITGGFDSSYIGALCGYINYSTISSCIASVQVVAATDANYIGGLCGYNSSGIISNSSAAGSISGNFYLGGLCGYNLRGTIENCSAAGSVSGNTTLGGLCGCNYSGTISDSYSGGQVTGGDDSYNIGGLCGYNFLDSISNCYATGSVSGYQNIGGLCGYNAFGDFDHCYATGLVTGYISGGFCGSSINGSITSCFWDTQSSGTADGVGNMVPDPYGVSGKTTAQMQTQSTFTGAGWDFVDEIINGSNDIWAICEGTNYPKLVWQIPVGDFVCPDGVDIFDLAELCEQWLLLEIPADLAPPGGDGTVNFADFSIFAGQWGITNDIYDLLDFSQQWLKTGVQFCSADIAPAPNGDRKVNAIDFALMAENWLYGIN